MTVYVDELLDYGVRIGKAGPEWCHLTADTPDELHDFAARLGMLRHWASDHTQPHSPLHYDLTRGKRMKALKLGAVERTVAERLQLARQAAVVPESAASAASESAMPITAGHPASRFERGQRVRIIANAGGLYGAQIGVVGVISQQRQKRRLGYYWYDVTYPSVGKPSERIVIVREDDLELDWRVTQPESGAQATPQAASEPRFALGQRVMLDRNADAAYERIARKGAVGVIVGIGKPVRGIRRYDVQYPGEAQTARERQRNPLGTLPMVHIREEHLLPVIADVDGKGVALRSVTPVYAPPAPASVMLHVHDDGTVTMRGRRRHTTQYPGRAYCAAAPAGDHGWQAWDSRYRRCRFCGDVERLPGERQEREATR